MVSQADRTYLLFNGYTPKLEAQLSIFYILDCFWDLDLSFSRYMSLNITEFEYIYLLPDMAILNSK